MIFIAAALAIVAGLTIAIVGDFGSMIGLTRDQAAHMLPLVIVLLLIAGGLFARRHRAGELVGGLVLWAATFAVVLTGYSYRTELLGVAMRVYGEITPGKPITDPKTGKVTFRRGLGGHFELDAKVDGATIPLIFDTGASAVVLTAADAKKAGIDVSSLHFDTAVATANGTGRAAVVSLASIDIGGIARQHIRAYVAADGALDTSLLGMTFLETLSRYAVTQDSLELTD
jgi:aspartyl protease family protein